MRGRISLWHGYVLKWMIKTSLLCLRFGALFVGSMRLEYVGSKTSPGQGWMVQVIYVYASEYCPGGQYSLVNNVQGDILWRDTTLGEHLSVSNKLFVLPAERKCQHCST